MKTLTRKKVNEFIAKYKHGLLLLYFLIYLPWFGYLEENVTIHFHVIHVALDDKIPFCEYSIIPYMLWFAYVAWGVAYFFFKNKSEYYKLCAFLFTGMTIFLVISTVYPNGHYLRPTTFERDNIFVQAVQWLYSTDTPTNLFPSIHVYNSLGINMAVWHSENFKKNKPVRYGSAILCISIILSTMFLKQHSVFDVVTGIVLAAFMFSLVYARSWANEPEHELEHNLHQY
ncbi:MAG: phosphatase PAP2 family protein [Roseburia sp.]|nr:phosphatase PAP2 family protein [Roseburia sp.]